MVVLAGHLTIRSALLVVRGPVQAGLALASVRVVRGLPTREVLALLTLWYLATLRAAVVVQERSHLLRRWLRVVLVVPESRRRLQVLRSSVAVAVVVAA